MATLEVHDGRGRVEYVAITRETPVLFGADPKCDVVLDDPMALPFHGRIRWRRGKFRVEAFPEAKALEVSGKKVVATRFLQGDEVRVGGYRIFMLNPEDKPPDAEPTIIRPPPEASVTPVRAKPKPLPRRRSRSDQEAAPPLAEFALVQESDPAFLSEATIRQGMPSRVVVLPPEVDPWWRRALQAVSLSGQAPGQERIATSPVVLGLVGVLVVLVVTGFSLWGIIARTTADRLFLQATDSEKNGESLNAIRLYDLFLQGYPKDARAGKARVYRALANVRQYASGAGPIWSNALEAAHEMVREVGRVPEYRDARMDLAELVLKTAEGLADRAKASADPKTLDQARQAAKFHEQVAGQAAKDLQGRSRLPAKLADAEAAVVKDQTRIKALSEMDTAVAKGSAAGVFAARDGLVDRYPDFALHRDVIARMTQASDLIRQGVTYSQATRAAESTPADDPLGPPTSLVLRSRGSKSATPDGPIVYALEDGLAYGLDGATGAPLWQASLGASCPFPPQGVPGGGSTALVVDARVNALICLEGRTGRLLWRQDLSEPVKAAPLVLGNQIVQATPTGKVLLIDLNSGELQGTLDLGLPLTQTPVADETGQFFYVLA
ncbi:MAG: PQQ-binding-like beta-propeller repeat protein, partial [Isosphaeraceae bacterium]